jgi:Ca2+-binding RTX toxin-like protein
MILASCEAAVSSLTSSKERIMRTAIALLTVMVAFLVGSGVALAAVITCPTGPGGECRGTKLADQITGTIGVDHIYALGGDDAVQGGDGADFIKGNLGADFLKGGSDDDEMYGGGGNDTAGGGPGNDRFFGGAGNERLSGGEGEDEIHGEAGDDIDLDGDASVDTIYGEDGNDLELDGDAGNDLLYGGPGNDGSAPTIDNLRNRGLRGEGGENQVHGDEGADTIDVQTAVDLGGAPEHILGGNDNDTITAADGVQDTIDCGEGDDTVVSYDPGLDEPLMNCEHATLTATAQQLP